jgi:Icc-related predicted phosphoesterase
VKLQIMSDLHIANWGQSRGVNYWNQTFPQETQAAVDVLVLAGDIVSFSRRQWAWSVARLQEFMARYKRVLYVPGNHEFYGTDIGDGRTDLDLMAMATGVDVLYPGKVIEIEGQRFLGGVMFQPNQRANAPGIPWPANNISDHWCINDFDIEAPAQYDVLRTFLEKELRQGDIVITHHAPSVGSLDAQWFNDPCNRWFITPEMEPLILERKPKLWIHGHVHTPFDYVLGETRIIANPKGYPGEGVRFNPQLIVEVP